MTSPFSGGATRTTTGVGAGGSTPGHGGNWWRRGPAPSPSSHESQPLAMTSCTRSSATGLVLSAGTLARPGRTVVAQPNRASEPRIPSRATARGMKRLGAVSGASNPKAMRRRRCFIPAPTIRPRDWFPFDTMERFDRAIRSRRHRQVMRAPSHLTLVPQPKPGPDEADVEIWYPELVPKATVALPRTALEHLDALYRVARSLTGRDDDAEDLVQETYARAISGWAQFATGTNLRAWLFRILRNAFIDNYRRSRNNPVRGGFDEELQTPAMPDHEPVRGDAELERLRGVVTADIER